MSTKSLKVVLVLLALLSLLTLSGCSGEDDIGELENWRENFFDVPSIEEQSGLLKIPTGILALLVLWCFMSTSKNLEDEGYATILIPIALSIGVFLFLSFPETAANIAQKALPQEVNLEWVLNKLRVVEDGNLGDKIYKNWVTSTISIIPKWFSITIIVLQIASFFAMSTSIIGRSQRGLVFIIASFIGVVAFMSFWVAFIYYLDRVWPGGDSVVRKAAMNLSFVFFTYFLFLLCFYALPISAFLFYPKSWDLKNIIKEKRDRENELPIQNPEKTRDLNSVLGVVATLLGYISGSMSERERAEETVNTTTYGYNSSRRVPQLTAGTYTPYSYNSPGYPQLPSPDSGTSNEDSDVIDGEFREIPPTGNGPDIDFNNDVSRPANRIPLNPTGTPNSQEEKHVDPTGSNSTTKKVSQTGTTTKGKKRKKPKFSIKDAAAITDLVATGAAIAGHPEVTATAKIVGTFFSTKSLAEEQRKTQGGNNDPLVTTSAVADLVSLVGEANNNEKITEISGFVGDAASLAAALKEKRDGREHV